MLGSDASASATARLADAVGLALVAALAAWVGLFAGGGAGRAAPVLWLLAGLVAAVAVGRSLASMPGLVPRVIATAVAGTFALTYPGILGAGGAPTGYANSNATLAAVGVIAALGAARAATNAAARQAWGGVTIALVGITVMSGSVAGILVLAVALGLLLVSAVARWAPVVLGGGLIATSLVLGVTTAMALDDSSWLAGSDVVRVELWAAAADLAAEEPLRGLGAGGFEAANPVSQDADLRWVHHEYLELAAELGAVGLALVLALVGWVTWRLWLAAAHDPARVALAGAAVTIVALHATVDHVWHTPAVLLLAAALVGDAVSPAQWQAVDPIADR